MLFIKARQSGSFSDYFMLGVKNLEQHLVVLRTRCPVEQASLQQDPFHASGRGKVSWFDRDRLCFADAIVGHFHVVSPNQAVVSLGMAKAFEGEGGFGHVGILWWKAESGIHKAPFYNV